MGWLKTRDFGVTPNDLGPLLGNHLVTMGVRAVIPKVCPCVVHSIRAE